MDLIEMKSPSDLDLLRVFVLDGRSFYGQIFFIIIFKLK